MVGWDSNITMGDISGIASVTMVGTMLHTMVGQNVLLYCTPIVATKKRCSTSIVARAFFFFFLILRRKGKNKALSSHTSTYQIHVVFPFLFRTWDQKEVQSFYRGTRL